MLADMSYGKQLKEARAATGLSQDEIAERIGVSRVAYRDWEEENSAPTRKQWPKIAEVLGINLMLTASEERPIYAVDEKYAYIQRLDVSIPAGEAREVEHEEVSGTHAYRKDWLLKMGLSAPQLRVVEVEGDSMAPNANDGDVILVNLADKRLKNGEAYVFRTDEGPRIKRLFRQLDGRIRVSSDNPDKIKFPDDYLTPMMQGEVIGRVVWRSGPL